jgi:hypothetical protein
LISKIQYNDCEPGEYKDEKDRTAEETFQLIEQFPWTGQRKNFHVGLTGPSITLQNDNGEFLKLGLYYNSKFVLYYFDRSHTLYTTSFPQYTEAYPEIRAFFGPAPFDGKNFQQQHTWPTNNFAHFVDRDFHYRVTAKRLVRYTLTTSGICFGAGLFFLGVLIPDIKWGLLTNPVIFIMMSIFLFFLGGGLNLILIINYYRFARGKLLIISQGSDIFYYGNENQPQPFNKKDITTINKYEPSGYRNPIAYFCWFEIQFKDDTSIGIPNILIGELVLEKKFPEIKVQTVRTRWPSIYPAASIPS